MDSGIGRAVAILRAVPSDLIINGLAEAMIACDSEAVKCEMAKELCATVAARGCDALAAIAEACGSPIWNALAATTLCLCGAENETESHTFLAASCKLAKSAADDMVASPSAGKFIFFLLLAKILNLSL
jgi:hypothetical protein